MIDGGDTRMQMPLAAHWTDQPCLFLPLRLHQTCLLIAPYGAVPFAAKSSGSSSLSNTAKKNFNCLNAAPEYVSGLRKGPVDVGQVYSQVT